MESALPARLKLHSRAPAPWKGVWGKPVPQATDLLALGRSSCALFRFFSLLFSYLVFVSFLVLFLSIFGSILGAKINEKTIKILLFFVSLFGRIIHESCIDFCLFFLELFLQKR